MDEVRKFIQHVVIPHVKNDDYVKVIDYKTELQEVLQIGGETTISYKILKEEGPAHDRSFVAAVFNNGKELGRGLGKSKKLQNKSSRKCNKRAKPCILKNGNCRLQIFCR